MKINIKEIFETDLDPNSQAWWSKDKLDKLNFNFNQFINGGMPGPDGYKGPDGDHGAMGPIGDEGNIGPIGHQGAQGTSVESEWIEYIPSDNSIPHYLFPKVNAGIEQTPITQRLGYIDPSSESSTSYNESVKTIYTSPIVGGTGSQSKIALRLQHDGKFSDFRIRTEGGFLNVEIGRIVSADPGLDLLNVSDEISYQINGSNYLNITSDLIEVGESQSINTVVPNLYSHDEFRFNQGAEEGYVLISEGTNGKAKWEHKRRVFASFPIGSIISIRESDFNNVNFNIEETINQVGPPYDALKITHGRGNVGMEYSGWYLCNGETWKSEDGIIEFQVPNLNSFNYTIDTNGDGQPTIINNGDNSPIIIGGSNIEINATQNNQGIYTTIMSIENDDEYISLEGIDGNAYISRMVHIIFLESTELYWSNSNTNIPEYSPVDYTLDYSTTT